MYLPHITQGDNSYEAYAVIIRCISHILNTYYELVDLQALNPSWPQIVRLVACGHILILACDAKHLHHREGATLFKMLIHLLGLHKATWPSCEGLATSFTRAAQAAGEFNSLSSL